MKNSTHTFICALIVLTGSIIDFAAGVPTAGLILLIITIIMVIMGLLIRKHENKK